jgi:hypothetical protein
MKPVKSINGGILELVSSMNVEALKHVQRYNCTYSSFIANLKTRIR